MKSAFSNDAGTKTETRGISVDSIEPASAPKNEASTSKDQASPKPAEGATSSGAAKNEDGSGPQGVAKPADAAKDQAKGASEDKPAEPSSEPNAPNSDGDEASKNKENRSVFVVDNFKDKEIDIDGDGTPDAAHGEVIARGLENQDFNVNRVKMGDRTISDALKDLNGKFESGKLPFKKGDVVNLSLGAGGDPSFETVRNALGVDVTPENVASKRGELFDALQRLPQEGPIPHILSINNSIKSLQKKGLEVVHSSGNDGSDKVSLGFLNAKHQLSATDAKGQIQSFSANHALTKPAQGVFGVTEVKGPNGQVSGFDVGGDGTQDFKASEVSGKGKRVSKPDASGSVSTIAGTSFSVLDFLQKQLPAN